MPIIIARPVSTSSNRVAQPLNFSSSAAVFARSTVGGASVRGDAFIGTDGVAIGAADAGLSALLEWRDIGEWDNLALSKSRRCSDGAGDCGRHVSSHDSGLGRLTRQTYS